MAHCAWITEQTVIYGKYQLSFWKSGIWVCTRQWESTWWALNRNLGSESMWSQLITGGFPVGVLCGSTGRGLWKLVFGFLFADCASYFFTATNHSRKYNYVLNSLSPLRESQNQGVVLGIHWHQDWQYKNIVCHMQVSIFKSALLKGSFHEEKWKRKCKSWCRAIKHAKSLIFIEMFPNRVHQQH